ncbi:MAG TPA: hypothetical protein VHW90_05880 [Stellaceae bacterium]|nr:hypothetical protein [Stellaceae bacterium]
MRWRDVQLVEFGGSAPVPVATPAGAPVVSPRRELARPVSTATPIVKPPKPIAAPPRELVRPNGFRKPAPRMVAPVAQQIAIGPRPKPVPQRPEMPRVEIPRAEMPRVEMPRAETARPETPRPAVPEVDAADILIVEPAPLAWEIEPTDKPVQSVAPRRAPILSRPARRKANRVTSTAPTTATVAVLPGAVIAGATASARALGGAVGSVLSAALSAALSAGLVNLRERVGGQIRGLARAGAAVASVGAVAIFAYQGGERLGGLAGTMNWSSAGPVHEAAAFTPPQSQREQPTRVSAPAGDTIGSAARAAGFLDRAKAGDPISQYNLAVLYARGDGVAQDYQAAASWFRAAASHGNPAAQFNLGVMYERGLGVKQNLDEAVAWYRKAATRSDASAQYNLAIAYAEGRGTPQDTVAAARWYHEAASQGLIPSMVNFAILYERGEGVERSLPNAYAWYRAAGQRGDAIAEQRAQELFQHFNDADKRQADMLAESVDNETREPAVAPPGKTASTNPASAPGPKPGAWTGRPVVQGSGSGRQPAG